MDVLIVGAGVVGLSTAYCLQRAGHAVTVVDRHAEVGLETSFANGAQLSYSYVAPLAGPGVLAKLPAWLLDPDAPMRFRPALDIDQWRWCLRFMRACTAARSDASTRHLLALSFLSRTLMHRLIAEEPSLAFDYARSGKLVLHRETRTFDAAVRLLAFQRALGCEQQALDAAACVRAEPALAHIRHEIVGGIHTASEDTADCHLFCRGLERLLRARGACFALGTPVSALRRARDGTVGAWSGSARLPGEHIVVAAGCDSAPLLKSVDIGVPLYPLKGYSLTVDTHDDTAAPRVSVTDFARKVVYARLGRRLRIAGMADLGDRSRSRAPEPRRLAALRREAEAVFPLAGDYARAQTWAGSRPATPAGTPILGPTAARNLWLNIGQGALGFTLAMGSAQLVSDCIDARESAIDRRAFALQARP